MPTAARLFAVMELLLVLTVAAMLTLALLPSWHELHEWLGAGNAMVASNFVPDGVGFRARTGWLFLVSPQRS